MWFMKALVDSFDMLDIYDTVIGYQALVDSFDMLDIYDTVIGYPRFDMR